MATVQVNAQPLATDANPRQIRRVTVTRHGSFTLRKFQLNYSYFGHICHLVQNIVICTFVVF